MSSYQTVASRIPMKYVVVKGAGQSNFGPGNDPWETTAYDLALLEAGIENCNIVKYTSVIPKEALHISMEQAEAQGLFHHGMVLETIMAQVDGNEGQHLCAGVATFDVFRTFPAEERSDELVGGFACEYEGYGSPEKARRMLTQSMNGLFERRYGPPSQSIHAVGNKHYFMANQKYHIHDLVVDDKFGTVLVALGFVSFAVPLLENLTDSWEDK